LPLPSAPDQTLFVYTARTQRDAAALRLLGSWSTGHQQSDDRRASSAERPA
jgi:hypothetical protein